MGTEASVGEFMVYIQLCFVLHCLGYTFTSISSPHINLHLHVCSLGLGHSRLSPVVTSTTLSLYIQLGPCVGLFCVI